MKALLIATTNAGKLREIEPILAGVPFELRTLQNYPPLEEPQEDGATFGENARVKALHYAAETGILTVAEDSGLEIDALDGSPGVQSARWEGRDYSVKFRRIHELLAERGLTTSTARFVCHLALADSGRILFETEQTVEGRISPAPAGDGGFGYDPIFFYPPLGLTLAQISREEKSRISHRGKAFSALRAFLATVQTD